MNEKHMAERPVFAISSSSIVGPRFSCSEGSPPRCQAGTREKPADLPCRRELCLGRGRRARPTGVAPRGQWRRSRTPTVGTLRLLVPTSPTERHEGEVFSCAYSADGYYVLSGGWDGQLRLWDASEGVTRLAVPTSPKPLSACRCAPDGLQWLAGSMDGLLTFLDGVTRQVLLSFVAHTRPISGIAFSPDGKQ